MVQITTRINRDEPARIGAVSERRNDQIRTLQLTIQRARAAQSQISTARMPNGDPPSVMLWGSEE